MLSKSIRKLVQYGIETGLTPECEKNYTINLLLDVFREEEYTEPEEVPENVNLEETLGELLEILILQSICQNRKRIQRPLQQQKMQRQAVTPNVFSVLKMKATQAV